MSSLYPADCLAAEYSFPALGDEHYEHVVLVTCPNCRITYRYSIIQHSGCADWHTLPCGHCGSGLPPIRCDLGAPLLIGAILERRRPRRKPRRWAEYAGEATRAVP